MTDQPTYTPHGSARNHLPAGHYTCPELQRNPGLPTERFNAYALPSRIGHRLHWPDGRVTGLDGKPL